MNFEKIFPFKELGFQNIAMQCRAYLIFNKTFGYIETKYKSDIQLT